MIVHGIRTFCCCLLLALPFLAGAHGGVVEEDDLCVIKVNYLRAHFKIYQPRASGHKQFCEDLPVASESVFIMEYEHDSLAIMPVDFRIIRDVTGKGRFARMEDVEAIADLDAATVFYRQPEVEPDVYTVLHNFTEEGEFIGIVSARHPVTGKLYSAVFPFEVGFTGFGYWPLIVGLLVVIQIQYLLMTGRLNRWVGRSSAVAVSLLLVAMPALADELVVTWSSEQEVRINEMHSWVLHIETEDGTPVEGAVIEVAGGMPDHDHGLPTRPRVTSELGGGDYKLDGMRFHMRGYWEIVVSVTSDRGNVTVTLPLEL